jgi:hypothetical protein
MADISSGLFALAGVTVGGAATYLAAARDSKSRAVEGRMARWDKLNDVRREAYIEFVKRADLLYDVVCEVWHYASPTDVTDDLRGRYESAWEAFVESSASVAVVGPQGTSESAEQWHKALAEVCNLLDPWLEEQEITGEIESKFDALTSTRAACKKSFLAAAAGVLS